MRSDMVAGDQFLEESVWDTSEAKLTAEPFSVWTVGSELGTFMVRNGFKKPPKRFALKLADTNIPSVSNDTVVDAKIGTFSAVIFDDYGGMVRVWFLVALFKIVFIILHLGFSSFSLSPEGLYCHLLSQPVC